VKLKKRNTHTKVISTRITSPETRIDAATGTRELLLSYVDASFNHCHNVAPRAIFLYAAGTNEEGDLPDGLDRLAHHKFVIHLDEKEQVVGLDVIPSRVYRSGVIPKSQKDVTTVKMMWMLKGAVCRITQRPVGITATQLIAVINAVDAYAITGKEIVEGTKLSDGSHVVTVGLDTIEIKLRSQKRGTSTSGYDLGDL
jgi:hypothetical protein